MSAADTSLPALRLRVARHEAMLDLIAAMLIARDLSGIARVFANKVKYVADAKALRFLGVWQPSGQDNWDEASELVTVLGGAQEWRCDYSKLHELAPPERALLLEGRLRYWEVSADLHRESAWLRESIASSDSGKLLFFPCQREKEFSGGWLLLTGQTLDKLDQKFLRSITQIMGELVSSFLAERAYRRVIALHNEDQRALIRDLSAVICPVSAGVLLVPIVGPFDAERTQLLAEQLFTRIKTLRAHLVIFELTGVSALSTQSIQALAKILRGIRFVGSRSIITGIQPDVARHLIAQDLAFEAISFRRNLSEALAELDIKRSR